MAFFGGWIFGAPFFLLAWCAASFTDSILRRFRCFSSWCSTSFSWLHSLRFFFVSRVDAVFLFSYCILCVFFVSPFVVLSPFLDWILCAFFAFELDEETRYWGLIIFFLTVFFASWEASISRFSCLFRCCFAACRFFLACGCITMNIFWLKNLIWVSPFCRTFCV